MKKLIVKSPAKINLYLKILKKFTDGYHEIDTAFQLIDLFDEIEFINSKDKNKKNRLDRGCNFAQGPLQFCSGSVAILLSLLVTNLS